MGGASPVGPMAGPRWPMLGLLAFAELLGMTVWFSATAVAPQLAEAWALGTAGAAWLTMAVQLGFVTGAAGSALLNLADIWPARRLFVATSLAAAVVNAAVVWAPGAAVGLVLRFLTGVLLAGVYPPAMKMAATWFRAERGLAIGTLVGALTIGSAVPHLTRALGGWDWPVVVLASSGLATVGAALVAAGYRDGPFAFPSAPFSWALAAGVMRERGVRLANLGYLGHMWELYACWTLIALFFHDYFLAGGAPAASARTLAGTIAFSAIAIGGLGAVLAGAWADRLGRERVTIVSLAVSGGCALAIGWLTFLPAWALVGIALVWGFAVVADSAQYSAIVTEMAPSHAVGTALTLQTSMGFLLTVFTIWMAARVSEWLGWGPAFSLLAIGPAFGIVAMTRLRRARVADHTMRGAIRT